MRPFDSNGSFMPPPVTTGEIRRLTVRGAGATLFAGGVTLGIQVVATVVLARLLTPSDFGVVAMVTTFSLLFVNFGFNGFTEVIVQRDEVDHALVSTLFWINVGFGVLFTAGFAASGSLLAMLFHDPQVRQVTEGISLSIVATSISTVHLALLKRAMRFTLVSFVDIGCRLVSVVTSIVFAWLGYGYWALVIGTIAQPVAQGIGTLFLCRWTPGAPRRVAGVGSALRFAISTYGNFGVNYLSRNTDNLLVGWRFDAQSLGYYKKAYDLFALSANQFVSSIAIVVVAGLSRLRKDDALYRGYLLDAIGMMAFLGMGLGAVLTLGGKDIILMLLGPKWGPAGQIFTFFGPGIGAMIIYYTQSWIHLSVGRPDRWFRWALIEFGVTFSMFIVGLHWGPVGIATAWSVSFWILTVPAIWYAGRPIRLSAGSLIAVIWKYIVASLISVSLTALEMSRIHLLNGTPHFIGALIRLTLVVVIETPLYLCIVVLLHGGFGPIQTFLNIVREMAQRGGAKEDALPAVALDQSPAVEPWLAERPVDSLPLVSILIPAYNAQEWIAGTIRSALAQTWPRKEIIVVDDGSKDATVAIARQFEPLGVLVHAQKNQGASAARNKAFSLSHGAYIQWLDADDLLALDKITRQMEPVVMNGLGPRTLLSGPWGYFMYRPHRANFVKTDLWCDLDPKEWLLRKMEQNIFMQTATWLVSRELTLQAGPWDMRLLGDDDGEYFCRVLMASEGTHFVPEAKVYYRAFRFDSLSYIGRFPTKIEAHWISMQLHIQYLRSIGGDDARTRAACMEYIRDSLIYFYPETSHILQQAENLAIELGEPLGKPDLSWKYLWIEACFGWIAVKPTQRALRRIRWRFIKQIDHLLFRIEQMQQSQPRKIQPGDPTDGTSASLAVRESRLT